MHRFILPFILSLVFIACQESKKTQTNSGLPLNVEATLKHEFPNAVEIEWEKKNKHYEVDLISEGESFEVDILFNGDLRKIEKKINVDDLPNIILNHVNLNYPGYSIEEVEFLKYNGNSFYELEIEPKHGVDGEDMEIVFSKEGLYLGTEREVFNN